MDITDVKDKPKEELQELLQEKKNELRSLRFKASERRLSQVHLVSDARRQIAQISFALKTAK